MLRLTFIFIALFLPLFGVCAEKSPEAVKFEEEVNIIAEVFIAGDYEVALEGLLKLDPQAVKLKGEMPWEYVYIEYCVGGCYMSLQNYREALKHFLSGIARFKECSLPEDESLAELYNATGVIYMAMSDHANAESNYTQAVRIYKKIGEENSESYLAILNDMAMVYRQKGEYDKALEQHLKVAETWKSLFGTDNSGYVDCLDNVGKDQYFLRRPQEALRYYTQALDIANKIDNYKFYSMSSLMSNTAQAYDMAGNFDLSMQLYNDALTLVRANPGSFTYISETAIYSNLSSLLSRMGDYPSAIEYSKKAIELNKVYGAESDMAVNNANSMGLLYFQIGDYDQALQYFVSAAEIQKKITDENHPEYPKLLTNIARVLIQKKEFLKALEILEQAFEIEGRIKDEPSYIATLETFALCLMELNENQSALEYLSEALELNQKRFGHDHPDCGLTLSNIGVAYFNMNEYQKALEYSGKAYEILKHSYGATHRQSLIVLSNIALDNAYLKQYDKALSIFCSVTNTTMDNISQNFARMTEQERGTAWANEDAMADMIFFANTKAQSQEGLQTGYNTALFSKGLLLNSSVEFAKIVAESGNQQAIESFEKLKSLQKRLTAIEQNPDADKQQAEVLRKQIDDQERQLLSLSKEYGSLTRNLSIDWKSVQARLSDNEVAVEFVRYVDFDAIDYANAAFVLRKGWTAPKIIFLFHEEPFGDTPCGKTTIKELMRYSSPDEISGLYHSTALYKSIWQPLEQYLNKGDVVYFSAAGPLHNLCIEYLPVSDTEMIYDRYTLKRLSSTKLLAMEQTAFPNAGETNAVLYGGLDYNSDSQTMLAFASEYGSRGSKSRFDQTRSSRGDSWSYLSGTKEEVVSIDRILGEQQYTTRLYTDDQGVEESIKNLSGKETSILHIATHGFYIPMQKEIESEIKNMTSWQQKQLHKDPMTRSGLIFAGANNAWMDMSLPDNVDDGILTSREIASLDFRKLDLVVLSACQTGLGDISTDGVYGLQRAFKIAGAQTIILSLWEVDDQATQTMMTGLYKSMAQGKSKNEAFKEAQKEVMSNQYTVAGKQHPGTDPYFWASFILLD